MMSWTSINEIANLIAVSTVPIPCALAFRLFAVNTAAKWIFTYTLLSFALDALTFYLYKVHDQGSLWLNPAYYVNFLFILSGVLYFLSKDRLIRRFIPGALVAGFIFLAIRIGFYTGFNIYDNVAWFTIQTYYLILCLIIFYVEIRNPKVKLERNPLLLISAGVFINCLLPLLTNLLQHKLYEASPDYYQMGLLVQNISYLIANLLFAMAVRRLKPSASPGLSPRLQELS